MISPPSPGISILPVTEVDAAEGPCYEIGFPNPEPYFGGELKTFRFSRRGTFAPEGASPGFYYWVLGIILEGAALLTPWF